MSVSIQRSCAFARTCRFQRILRLAVLIPALLIAQPVLAQVLTGEIDGTVKDTTGAVVPNASVLITNTDVHLKERSVKTDANGQFTAPLLPIGVYAVTVSGSGFKTSTVTGLEVHVGQPAAVPITLAVGEINEQVEVTASQAGVQLIVRPQAP